MRVGLHSTQSKENMNNPVSGESSAKGLSVILPYIAVGPAAVAIRRPELWNAWNLAGQGNAGRGWPWLAKAWQGKEHGRAHPQEQQTNTTQWNKHTATH